MTTISLIANDQLLTAAITPIIASGDQNTVKLHIDFTSEWDDLAKSAVFFTAEDTTVYEMVLDGAGECTVPHEVLAESGILFIGARGVNSVGALVKTSTLVKQKIKDGAPSGKGTTVQPTASVYHQLLTQYAVLERKKADRAELIQQTPLFPEKNDTVNNALAWLAENGDTSKVYVLPDGYIYGYMGTVAEIVDTPNFTNLMDDSKSYIKEGHRYSHSGGKFSSNSAVCAVVIPITTIAGTNKLRVRGATKDTAYYYLYSSGGLDNNTTFSGSYVVSWATEDNGDSVCTFDTSEAQSTCVTFTVAAGVDADSLIVTLNEEITYTQTVLESDYQWLNTGHAFVPADYEDRIVANELAIESLEKVTESVESRVSANEQSISDLKNDTENLETQLKAFGESQNIGEAFSTPAFAPVPQLPADGSAGSDFNAETMTTQDAYDYMDVLVNKYKGYITKQTLGKDESGNFDYNRYILCTAYWRAWQRENYPKMFAWKNGSTVIYSVSVSPRVGDTMYKTPYIGTVYATVASVNCTAGVASTRTVNGLVFNRYSNGDVEPVVVYTRAQTGSDYLDEVVYDSAFNQLTTRNSVDNSATSIVCANGNTYIRYPFEDRKADKTKPLSIFMLANEHGAIGDCLLPSIAQMRMANDLCKNTENPFLKWLKANAMITMIPVGNPYGYGRHDATGYYNANGMNINRNYDTPGWASSDTNYGDVETFGEYAGCENETQYIMNTMHLCKPDVGISMHGMVFSLYDDTVYPNNGNAIYQGCGFDSSRMPKIAETLFSAYNYGLGGDSSQAQHYNNCGKSPAYIQFVGAVGGLTETNSWEANTNIENNAMAMEQAYTEMLLFLQTWCEEALEKTE